jgi:hypothetical protein
MSLLQNIDEFLHERGIKDFDDLRPDEKESYFKLLELAESSNITLQDLAYHTKVMRQSVELALATEKLTHDEDLFIKARLKCYLIFESFFDKPERAKKMLEQYKRTGVK